jgi:hypothetical protein
MDQNNKVEPVEHNDIVEDEKYEAKKDDDTLSINSAALGDDLPPGYFYSPRFLGAMTVRITWTISQVFLINIK